VSRIIEVRRDEIQIEESVYHYKYRVRPQYAVSRTDNDALCRECDRSKHICAINALSNREH
jgi:hypothetical protein